MATSKTGGSTQNNRDSHSKRLSVKLFDGQQVHGGEIIVRQRGTKFHPGKLVAAARLYILCYGSRQTEIPLWKNRP